MTTEQLIQNETIYVKNMVCNCCKILLQEKLEIAGIKVREINLGKIRISYHKKNISRQDIKELLLQYGFDLLENKDEKLISQIKATVFELIHELNNVNSIVRKSDYMVEKLGYSYQHLSRIFSEHEHLTLERYIILQKIEKIKHMLDSDEYSLSEIAYMMDYSSVQYLSNQFKKITGVTVSQYKAGSEVEKRAIDSL